MPLLFVGVCPSHRLKSCRHDRTFRRCHSRPHLSTIRAADTQPRYHQPAKNGIIQLTGNDRLNFLHNQSTNNFNNRHIGQVIDTTFTSPIGRAIDFGTVLVRKDDAFVLVSPECVNELTERFDRHIFPSDEVEVKDVSKDYVVTRVFGRNLNLIGHHGAKCDPGKFVIVDDVIYIWGSGLSLPGFRVIEPISKAELQRFKDFEKIDDNAYERLRVKDGRPCASRELARKWIVLEAGLWHTVSFEKGCYIGQETVAKLNLRDGVNNWLVGLKSEGVLKEGAVISDAEGKKVGEVTSSIADDDGSGISLGYVKRKKGFGETGKHVMVDGVEAVVRHTPFVTRSIEECADAAEVGSA